MQELKQPIISEAAMSLKTALKVLVMFYFLLMLCKNERQVEIGSMTGEKNFMSDRGLFKMNVIGLQVEILLLWA